MAGAVIAEAIEVGVPAYNSGEIALCAQIYEETASSLLRGHKAALKPSVARQLEDTLVEASGKQARGQGKGSEADRLAWAFRRAFDEQLKAGSPATRKRGRSSGGASSPSVQEVIGQAIAMGAPAYNRGDIAGCERIYTATAQQLLASPGLSSAARGVLEGCLQQCKQLPDVNKRAWALRRALDAVASGATVAEVAVPARRPPSGGGKPGLLHDFVRNAGLEVRGNVVNDTVMGGRSDSDLQMTSAGAVFQGNVTRRGGGGFASVRFEPRGDTGTFAARLQGGSGLAFTVRAIKGCTAWKVQLSENQRFRKRGAQWQADFTAPSAEGTLKVPFSTLVPSTYGRTIGPQGMPSSARDNVASFGFMLSFLTAGGSKSAAFQEGPFAICISSIEVY